MCRPLGAQPSTGVREKFLFSHVRDSRGMHYTTPMPKSRSAGVPFVLTIR
jgi:hypothetical protein